MKTLTELLAELNAGIKSLNDRAATGEDVTAEMARLTEAKAALAADASQETELERLRRVERERSLVDQGSTIASEIVQRVRTEQADQAKQLTDIVQKQVADQLAAGGEGGLEQVVRNVLAGQRGGSRFAGDGASDAVLTTLAAGGSIGGDGSGLQIADHKSLQVAGAVAECDRIRESKNIAHFMGMMARAKNLGSEGLSEGERMFLRECRTKALAEQTDSAGGFMIHPQWMPDILGLLRSQAVVRKAGPRSVPFAKQMNQTAISSGSTAFYSAENAAISPSGMTFADTVLLTPHNLTGLVPVSNYLLQDSPEADSMVRGDLGIVMALREDLAFLQGTGSGGEPTGLKNISGRTLNPLTVPANGFQPTLQNLRALRNIWRTFNVSNPRFVWFWPPQFTSYLESLQVTSGGVATGQFLVDANIMRINDDGISGTFDGNPFFTSTQIPVNLTQGTATNASYLMLVNMNEAIIGDNQGLELAVSSEASYTPDGGTTWVSAFQSNQTLFRAVLRHDIAHRRPNQVIVQAGVLV